MFKFDIPSSTSVPCHRLWFYFLIFLFCFKDVDVAYFFFNFIIYLFLKQRFSTSTCYSRTICVCVGRYWLQKSTLPYNFYCFCSMHTLHSKFSIGLCTKYLKLRKWINIHKKRSNFCFSVPVGKTRLYNTQLINQIMSLFCLCSKENGLMRLHYGLKASIYIYIILNKL